MVTTSTAQAINVTELTRVLSLVTRLAEATAEAQYQTSLRGPLRRFWRGEISDLRMYERLFDVINFGLTRAFFMGASDVAIARDELTQVELGQLDQWLRSEIGFLDSFVDRVIGLVRKGAKLGQVFNLLKPWYNRFDDIRNRARVLVGRDVKLIWLINIAKENCRSCLRLHGIVKRASQWAASGYRPQNPPNKDLV